MMNIAAAAQKEVIGLHQFFEVWFTGAVENNPVVFLRVAEALARDFHYVVPSGRTFVYPEVIEQIRGAHGGRRQFRIEIRNMQVREVIDGTHALVQYEEHQWTVGEKTARVSSALFRANEKAPAGVEWVHLQETWQGE